MKHKRLVTILLAFVLVLSLLPVMPSFAASYSIYVRGTQITDANKDDVLGDGKVSFDPASSTLTFNNSVISYSSSAPLVWSMLDDLTVNVNGAVQLEHAGGRAAISSSGKLTLKHAGGAGRLICISNEKNGEAIYADGDILIDDLDLTVRNTAGSGIESTGGNVTFNSCKGTVSGSVAAVRADSEITFTGCEITSPAGCTVSGGKIMSGSTEATQITLEKKIAAYDLWVKGEQVTDTNKDDILGDGSCSYAPTLNCLVLEKDITFSSSGNWPVVMSTMPLLLVSTGEEVTLMRTDGEGEAIQTSGDLMLTGSGTLTAISNGNTKAAIQADGEITITVNELDALGGNNGIVGKTVEIPTSTVHVKGSIEAIKAEDALTLGSTLGIVKPAGGKQMGIHIRDAAGNLATEVLLMVVENYDLKVCGTQVNTGNAADILGDGVFQYLPEQNILAVKSSCEWHDAPIIESWIEELGISSMDGEYVLTAVDASAIVLHKDASIGGTGTLTVSGTNAIYADGCELMLYKAKVNATGTQYGISGSGSGAKLTIFESSTKESTPGTTITAKGTTAAIAGFADITLNGCYIKTPEDGGVKDGAIVDANGAIAKEVEIVSGTKPDPAGKYDLFIAGVQVTADNKDDILSNGIFAYDPAANTLEVLGHYAASGTSGIILNNLDNLTIKFINNSILEGTGHVIETTKNLRIDGNGKYCEFKSEGCAIYANGYGVVVTLENLEAKLSGKWGITGEGADERLVIDSCDLTVDATDNAICDFGAEIVLVKCEILEPAGAKIESGSIVGKDDEVVKQLHIGKSGSELVNPFKDVFESDYYYTPVLWAYYHTPQVTNGTTATTFSPKNTCTRAQIVTFLWRAKGCPEPALAKSPFTDVTDPKAYYYKAVLWAVENGITTGTSATTFSPNDGCTRAQVVTFLWRTEGKPAPSTSTNPFRDVPAGQYYTDAVLWAVGKGVTTGTSADKFSPNATCTRAQIVTFLYRDLA